MKLGNFLKRLVARVVDAVLGKMREPEPKPEDERTPPEGEQ